MNQEGCPPKRHKAWVVFVVFMVVPSGFSKALWGREPLNCLRKRKADVQSFHLKSFWVPQNYSRDSLVRRKSGLIDIGQESNDLLMSHPHFSRNTLRETEVKI